MNIQKRDNPDHNNKVRVLANTDQIYLATILWEHAF